ncbi:MAG: hypothetical protein NUV51_10900 [Sulfuricaulis sp.]|nr:hypothetical protein [Sulfuricaulis sp.]
MTTTTLTKTARTLIAAATSNAAGSATRGTVDLRTAQGGMLTIKVTNGATGPTVAPTITVSVAHNAGATPTAGAEGSDWKRMYQVGGDSTNNSVNQWSVDVPPGVMHLQVEVTGNTAQAVTCEAFLSEITSVASA